MPKRATLKNPKSENQLSNHFCGTPSNFFVMITDFVSLFSAVFVPLLGILGVFLFFPLVLVIVRIIKRVFRSM